MTPILCSRCRQRTARDSSGLCIPCQQAVEMHEPDPGFCLNCGQHFSDDPEPEASALSGLCYHCRSDITSAGLSEAEARELLDRLQHIRRLEGRALH